MREYGFSPTRIQFYPYTGEHGSVKTRIPAYFMQCTDNDSQDCRGEEGIVAILLYPAHNYLLKINKIETLKKGVKCVQS